MFFRIPSLFGMLFFCLALQAQGQRIPVVKPLEVISFRYDGSQMLLPVTVNGGSDTLHFLFDTGCEVNLLASKQAHKLGLKDHTDAGLSGWSKAMTMMPQVRANSINIGTLSLPYPVFYLKDLSGANMQGIAVDGVIGYDLLRRYAVKIDFQNREMSLYRSGNLPYPPAGERLKLGMNYKTPTVEASLTDNTGRTFHSTYHIITGGNFGLLLNGDYIKKYGLDTKLRRTGTVTRKDLLQPVTYTQCMVPLFSLSKHTLTNVPALYSSQVDDSAPDKEIAGAIGAQVWKYFTLFINLPRKELYLMRR